MSNEKLEQSATTPDSSNTNCYLTEHEKQIYNDYEWCIHDPEIRQRYGDQVVAVHQRRIWGVGKNLLEALNAALQQPGCPPRHLLALALVPPIVPEISDSYSSGS